MIVLMMNERFARALLLLAWRPEAPVTFITLDRATGQTRALRLSDHFLEHVLPPCWGP